MAELIGVTSVRSGFVPDLSYAIRRSLGARPCPLKALSHGVMRPSKRWRDLATRLHNELGHTLTVVSPNRAEPALSGASAGREPCVLIRDIDGGVSMIVDWNDLALTKGHIDVFERILRSKLLMY